MKFLFITVVVLTLAIAGSVCAQELLWTKYYGREAADFIWRDHTVRSTPEGGFIIAGHSEPPPSGPYDIFLVRTDSAGDTTWTRSYGPGGAYGVATTYDGGYVVTGSGGYGSTFILKVDSEGDPLWSLPFTWNGGFSVQETSDSGLIFTGSSSSTESDIFLAITDRMGITEWIQTFGGAGNLYRCDGKIRFRITGMRFKRETTGEGWEL